MNSSRDPVYFKLFGHAVSVIVGIGERDMIESLFPEYLVTNASPSVSFEIVETSSGWQLERDGERLSEATKNHIEFVSGIEYAVINELLGLNRRFGHIHCSGITGPSGAAAIMLGGSGAGKSSIALSWSLSGRPVLGDDIVLFDEDQKLFPVKRLFELAVGRIRHHGLDPNKNLFWTPDQEEVWFDPRSAGGWAEVGELRELCILRYQPGSKFECRGVDRSVALNYFQGSLMETGASPSELIEPLFDVVERSRTWEVVFGEADDVTNHMGSLLK